MKPADVRVHDGRARVHLVFWGSLGGFLLAAAACDNVPTAPLTVPRSESCRVPVVVRPAAHVARPASQFADLRAALAHAAGPMMAQLREHEQARELADAMTRLARGAEAPSAESACDLVNLSLAALAALPDTPETRPDRDGIRMVLALVAEAILEREGF